jgi:hypothetical protein
MYPDRSDLLPFKGPKRCSAFYRIPRIIIKKGLHTFHIESNRRYQVRMLQEEYMHIMSS